MLTDYIFRTAPVLDLPSLLILAQIAVQSVSPVTVMYGAIRRQNPMERLALSLFPLVFFITFVFMDVLLGSSFLGGGFRHHEALVQYLLFSPVLIEVWVLLLLFPVTFFTVRRWPVKTPLSLLGGLVSWGMYLFCFAITVHTTLVGAASDPLQRFILWYVYSIYAVLFQVVLNLTAIMWHALFSERPLRGDLDDLLYEPLWCRHQISRLLLSGHRVFFCAMFPLILLLYVLLIPALAEEGFNTSTIFTLAELHVFLLPMVLLTLFMLVRILFPSTLPALRRIDGWKNASALQRQFCQEYFNPNAPPLRGSNLDVTGHFILVRSGLKPAIYYIPFFQQTGSVKGRQALLFQDGSALFLTSLAPVDAALVKRALTTFSEKSEYLP